MSPDGSKIAFYGAGPSDLDIVVMNADGTIPVTLPVPGDDLYPTWSPDGKKIAFEQYPLEEGNFNYEVFVMNADGTNPTNLTNHPTFDVSASWQRTPALPLAAHPPIEPGSPPASTPPPWASGQAPRR